MAGQSNENREQHLRQSANDVADMLRQLQNATLDSSPIRRGNFRGSSRGTPRGARNPIQQSQNIQGYDYNCLEQRRQGYNRGPWNTPEGSWRNQGGYGSPPPHDSCRRNQGGYGGPPPLDPYKINHGGYGGPPPQDPYRRNQGGYGGPPPQDPYRRNQGGYGGPPPQDPHRRNQGGYGGPPPQDPYRRNQGGYGGPPPQDPHRRNQGGYGGPPPHDPYIKPIQLTPRVLVECLANFHTFSASLLQLMEEKSFQPSSVREIALTLTKIFYLNNEVLELKPQIKICTAHTGTQGCLRRSSCSDLHICSNYVLNSCHEKNCVLGHKWMTDHNISVLKSFFLERLSVPVLRCLIQSMSKPGDAGKLEVCRSYNEGGCDQSDCGALHVCLSFVVGLTKCSRRNCQLNHKLLSPDCCQLLKTHDLPTNESPRDIVMALLSANPSLTKKEQSSGGQERNLTRQSNIKYTSEKITKEDPTKTNKLTEKNENNSTKKASRKLTHKKDKQCSSESDSSSETEDKSESDSNSMSGSSSSDEEQNSDKSFNKSKSPKSNTDTPKDKISEQDKPSDHVVTPPVKQEIRRTLWSHYLQGDVSIPEICYYSVEEMCKYEGSGCHRLHSTQHFHWQVSEQGNRWLNLRLSQVTCLERTYCDPSQDGVDLPRLDPATLEISVGGLLILMGRDTWHADFKAMNLTNSSKTKTLHIRRLCTEAVSGQVIKPTIFTWYFLDKNKKWVKYGNVDTVGETNLVSSVTSDDIEKHFKHNPSVSLSFKNSQFTYTLDFNTMVQTNQNTNFSREVQRRPEPHLPDEKTEKGKDQKTDDFPSGWEVMQPEERVRLVALAPSSSEYLTVVALLAGKIQSANVMKVERIQNPFLWRALQNKIKEMTTVYGDASKVNIQQLFHGTGHNVISSICAENFDWRLHGSSTGQVYGRGTYFSTDAAYSYNYCRPDNTGMKFMFVARTAVGTSTVGNSSMVRPPTNTATNLPFDSTVNNQLNPTIIVKYDKQEYYPEYILTLT